MIVAHPCAMRGVDGQLRDRLLVAAVSKHEPLPAKAWAGGYFALMPLPDLVEAGLLCVAQMEDVWGIPTETLRSSARIACLSEYGVNLLQQRLVWHMTRLEVPTFTFHEAFAHTQEEADLLEEWNDVLCAAGFTIAKSTSKFDTFLRSDKGDGKTLQGDLRDPQRRSAVRMACRAEARRLSSSATSC